jgi:epsilon-lactone hydrolase
MPDEGPLALPARAIPYPASLSEAAVTALRKFAAGPLPNYPDPGDFAGWVTEVRERDTGLLTLFKPSGASAAPVEIETIALSAAPLYDVRPVNAEAPGVIYEIHGGGLVLGAGKVCQLMASGVAAGAGARTYAIDYRMPPHHPFPAGLDDCLEGYRWLLERHEPGQIIVRGGSAGANLAAALMLRLRDLGLPFPAAVVLLTPEVDLTESGDSFATNLGLDVMLKCSLMNANLLYAAGHDLADPLISPLFADFAPGFPPCLITAGTRDLFLSNAARLNNALRRSGNHAELVIEEGMPHGGFFGAPEDGALLADVNDFMRRAWAGLLPRRQPPAT